MKKIKPDDLLFVSKSPKERLDYLAAGASLVERTGRNVKQLRCKAARDRIELAAAFLRDAKAGATNGVNMNRTTVSRAYYAMYHALRAATFLSHGGDDNEEHTKLPSKLPQDFPDAARWQDELKSARLERNRADYDPYPRQDQQFAQSAQALMLAAEELLKTARRYVRLKSEAMQ